MPEPTSIRVNKELYKQAKIQAIKEGRPVYEFINEAIQEKLERSKGK